MGRCLYIRSINTLASALLLYLPRGRLFRTELLRTVAAVKYDASFDGPLVDVPWGVPIGQARLAPANCDVPAGRGIA